MWEVVGLFGCTMFGRKQGRLDMVRRGYSTDLTDAQWAVLAPHLPTPDHGQPIGEDQGTKGAFAASMATSG